jgi:hypothetical protein
VDEDNLPATVVLGGKRFDVDRTIREASKNVKLVRLSADDAARQLRDGRVVAVVTVPPGFISTLRGMVHSPQLQLELSRGTISTRVEQQVQALVYSLNLQLQRAYIASNLRYVSLILRGGDGSFLGAPITVLGIEKAQRLLPRCRGLRGRSGCSTSWTTLASRWRARATRSARRRTRSSS